MKPNTVYKPLRELTREEFEVNMKTLMRWAKDNGYYTLLRNYLDRNDVIFDRLDETFINGDFFSIGTYYFCDVLRVYQFFKTKYEKYGPLYWTENILPLHRIWSEYYKEITLV